MFTISLSTQTLENLYKMDPPENERWGNKLVYLGLHSVTNLCETIRPYCSDTVFKTCTLFARIICFPLTIAGAVGIGVKALQKSPFIREEEINNSQEIANVPIENNNLNLEKPINRAEIIDEFFGKFTEIRSDNLSNVTITVGCSIEAKISLLEIWEKIFVHLDYRTVAKMALLTKSFKNLIYSTSEKWHPLIMKFRIHGAGHWCSQCLQDGNYTSSKQANRTYENIAAYANLCINGEAGKANLLNDYIARLMEGGPLAFKKIPNSEMPTNEIMKITPENITAPIVRGKIKGTEDFYFAIRVKEKDKDPTILTYVGNKANFKMCQKDFLGFKVKTQVDFNILSGYLLSIINHTDLTIPNNLLFKKVELHVLPSEKDPN